MDHYARKAHFAYFRSLAYPYVGVTANVNVSELVAACKAKRCSFYIAFLHASALAADSVEELRQRIDGEGIVEYEECPTSHIELLEDGTYCYCTLHHHVDICRYMNEAEATRERCRTQGSIEEDEGVNSMYFISTLPWITYTSLVQPVSGGDESNPRITWGKYEPDFQGNLMMPVSILAHHALVDGKQISDFYQNLSLQIHSVAEEILQFL